MVEVRFFIGLGIVVTSFGMVLSGCSGAMDKRAKLDPAASRVELVTAKPNGCENLGDVSGIARVEGDDGEAAQEARNDIRNKAAAKGATHVELQTNNAEEKSGAWATSIQVTLTGAYHCDSVHEPTSTVAAQTSVTPPVAASASAAPIAEQPTQPGTSAARNPAQPGQACTPGATQACVGPGGCQGGQFCTPDGMAFSSCDCGKAAD
jgi:hypothetical protein